MTEQNEVFMACPMVFGKQLETTQVKALGQQFLQLLFDKSDKIPPTLDSIIAEHSCKSAIKFGDEIN